MPTRDDQPRDIVTSRYVEPTRQALAERSAPNNFSEERYISPVRESVQLRQEDSRSLYSDDIQLTESRYLEGARQPLLQREYNRVLSVVGDIISTNPQIPPTTPPTFAEAVKNYYDPASSSASSGLNASGGISVIPGGEINSGNSNTILILFVILAGVGLGYWYYKRGM